MADKRRTQGEGSIYFDPSRGEEGRWVAQAWIGGRRRKVVTRTKAEAAKRLGALVHGADKAERTERASTVASLLEDWLGSLDGKDLAPTTREAHRWAAEMWSKELGRVKVADLTVANVEAGLASMAAPGRLSANGLGRASLVKARSTLRQACQWALRRNLVTFNPAAVAELPTSSKAARPRRHLDAEQVARLAKVLKGHPRRALYLLSARVGLRPGEAAGVTVGALDLDGDPPTVAVVRAVQLQGGRPRLVEDLKTARSRRVLALPSDVVDALRDAVEALGPDADGDALLFPAEGKGRRSSAAGGPLWPSTVRAELADLCALAKVPVVSSNELRHSAATAMVEVLGLAPHEVADVLGHTSPRMVESTYRHRPTIIRGADRLAV